MSGTYDFRLSPGASRQFSVTGNSVQIIRASVFGLLFRIRLDGGDSFVCLEGQGVRLPQGKSFSEVLVTNIGVNTVMGTLFAGDAMFMDSFVRGNVQSLSEISEAVDTFLVQEATLGVTAWKTTEIVSPLANTSGIIIRNAQVSSVAGAGGTVTNGIVACKSDPTGIGVPSQQVILLSLLNSSTSIATSNPALYSQNIRLTIGWGLYLYSIITGSAATLSEGRVAHELGFQIL